MRVRSNICQAEKDEGSRPEATRARVSSFRAAFLPLLPVLLTAALLSPARVWSAADVGDFQLSLNRAPAVVMGDSSSTLSLTLTNAAAPGGDTIGWFRLYVDANSYYVSIANEAPAGWVLTEVKNAGVGQSYATYEAIPGWELAVGDSVAVDLLVTGFNDGPFPAAASDVTDSLEKVAVQVNSNPNADFFTGLLPTWTRHGLKAFMSAVPSAVGVGDPITVSMLVTNRTTTSQGAVTSGTLTVTGTGGGAAAYASGPAPPSTTIPPGVQQVFNYTYTATATGNVIFSGAAAGGAPTIVSSPAVNSNGVQIGDFTAVAALDLTRVISGQHVTVTLTLTNNGPTNLSGITPFISPSGTATLTLVSGPSPAGMGALPRGKSTSVQWIYEVSGIIDDTYQFTVWGQSSTISSNMASTPEGRIFAYAASVSPDTVTSGATGVTLAFTASNAGGGDVRQVAVSTPSGWVYQGAAAPAGWTVNTNGNPVTVTFRTTTDYIAAGGSETFYLTFSAAPVVTNPTPYNFLVGLWDMVTRLNDPPTGSVETEVTVLPYQVVITAAVPGGFPTPPVADGVQYYDLIATVTDGTGPVAGALVQFTATVGSLGSVTAVSDTSGQALNTLTGPLSITPVVSTVTADYLGATDSILLNFDPYTGLALDYIPASLSPVSVTQGDTVSFTVQVINTDVSSVVLSTATTFSFSDTSVGGVSTYSADLASSAPATILPGQVATLTFQAAAVAPVFLQGSYNPDLFLTDGLRSGTRAVTDQVQVRARATLLALKSISAVSDPVNLTVNPRGVPGGVMEYSVAISNVALGEADADSVVLTEIVPPGTELYVGDLDGSGSPVAFTDGAASSALSYSFGGLGDPGDDISFSSDPGPSPAFGYTPQDPDGDGYDPAVTYLRVNPKGTMAGSAGLPYSSFSLTFRVRIQ